MRESGLATLHPLFAPSRKFLNSLLVGTVSRALGWQDSNTCWPNLARGHEDALGWGAGGLGDVWEEVRGMDQKAWGFWGELVSLCPLDRQTGPELWKSLGWTQE